MNRMRHLLAALLLAALAFVAGSPAHAQGCGPSNPNCIVTTMPTADTSKRAASDEFVHNVISGAFAGFANPTATIGRSAVNGSAITGMRSDSAPALPPGVDVNDLNLVLAAPSLSSSNCGQTITLGGNAFYTVTLGAASGFPATCTMTFVDIDSGRAKKMSVNGITYPNGSMLWPLQVTVIKNVNNVWTVAVDPGRWKLSNFVQFEVNSAGSNGNDGLATGAANAFQTIPGAISVINTILDARGFGVVLHADCSGAPTTYTGQVRPLPIVGQAIGPDPTTTLANNLTPVISGDTTTPGNCILTSASGPTVALIGGTYWNIQGFQLKNTDGSSPCLLLDQQSWTRFQFIDFNSCNGASGNHIVVENFSGAKAAGNYTISVGASAHVFSTLGGEFLYGLGTITLTGTPIWASSFASANRNSFQFWGGATFSGASTGPRYNASLGGGIDTNGGGATFLPGNSAGSATNPGWYN